MSTSAVVHETWVPDLSSFAARLAVVRHGMSWNAKEAALACGFPASSWRNWEAGKRPHDFARVCETIAARTNVPAAWLAFGPEAAASTDSGYHPNTSGWYGDSRVPVGAVAA